MKKIYFLLFLSLLFTRYTAFSQCDETAGGQFPSGIVAINPSGTLVTITTCSFAGEYSQLSGAVNGQTLRFTSSVATDFITVRSGSSSGPVLAFGTTPLVFANTFTGNIFVHWSANAACGDQASCRTTTVQCTSCTPPPPPVNDLCTGALPIACGGSVSGNTSTGATIDPVPTCVTTLNTAPGVWYTFVGTGQLVTLNTCTGTTYDSKIGVFSGTCASLVCVTGNDDFCGLQSQVSFIATLGTTYYVLVTGFGANTGAFTLSMTCAAGVPNDNCSGALPIPCNGSVSGTTVGATVDPVAGTCGTILTTAPGIWYTFVGTGGQTILNTCTGTAYDSKIGVFSGTCAGLVCVAGNDDFCGLQSQVTFNSVAGTTYYVLVTGFGTSTGAFTLSLLCRPPNDLCTGALPLACGAVINGTSVGATAETGVPVCGGNPNTGVWYTFTGSGGTEVINTCTAGSFDTKLLLYTGTCAALTCVANNDDFCGLRSQITFTGVLGTTYYLLVTGFGATTTGTFTLTRTCAPACVGVPSPGAIAPVTTNACIGNPVTLTLSGYSNQSALSFQWKESPTPGGPYTNIAGANNITYTFTAAATRYYVCTVTCTNGNGNGTTAEVVVNVSNIQHSNVTVAPSLICSPGSFSISAVASGSAVAGNYTHTLTGPGTISAPVVSGANNANVTFNVSNVPFGNQTYTLISTDAAGCNRSTSVPVTVNQTPAVAIVPPAATICNGNIQQLTATATLAGSANTISSGAINLNIPDNNPAGVTTAPIVIPSGVTIANPSDLVITINARHSWVGDLIFRVNSPCGTTFLFDRPGVPPGAAGNSDNLGTSNAATPPPAVYTFNLGAATIIPETATGPGFIPTGSYRPSNTAGTAHNWAGLTFPCNGSGNWTLTVSDNAGLDVGQLVDWSIAYPSLINLPVVFSPTTNVFTDAAATVAYTGTPVNTVWVRPTTTTTYTATATTGAGCSASATSVITVNQLPAIVTQPTPATQTLCPGFNVVYSVAATGTGITYQWRRNGTNLTDGVQILGSNTPTLRIFNIAAANGGNYDCVISGVCPPPVTTTPVTLVVGAAPTINTQPANATICAITSSNNNTATFSVAASGSPAPTIYQWQISTNGGGTWTNLANSATSTASPFYNGVFTSSLTVGNAPASLSTAQYRVLVTNSCNQTTTSNGAVLTVNPAPVVAATDLFNRRVCISDTLVPLLGTPSGGVWTGIGVSGSNFIPGNTAVGNYVLTYTVTSAAGCIVSDTARVFVQDCPERARLLRDDALIVYPNPNNGRFNVRMNSTLYNYLGMKVYDMSGRLLNGRVTKNGTDQQLVSPTWNGLYYGRVIPIDLSYLPSGNYLVKFYYDDGVRTSEKGFIIRIMR